MKALIIGWICLLYAGSVAAQYNDNSKNEPFICGLQESVPEYPGGLYALKKFIRQNTVLPDSLQELQGRVVVSFDIMENGRVVNARILRSLHPVADSMALDMVSRMPRWKPATVSGKPVKASYTMPVPFMQE